MTERVVSNTCPFCGNNRLFVSPDDVIVCPPCVAGLLPDRAMGHVWVKPCSVCKRDPAFAAIHNGCERCEKRAVDRAEEEPVTVRPQANENAIDDINKEFELIAFALAKAGYTTPTSIPVPPSNRSVKWKRHKNRWGFWVIDEHGALISIDQESALFRIDMALHIEDVVRGIQAAWTLWAEEASRAILTMRKVRDRLERLEGKELDDG